MSKVAMSMPSCASIINDLNSDLSDILGDAKSSPLFKKSVCLLTFLKIRPLIVPVRFYLIRLTASKASLFSVLVDFVGSCGSKTGLLGITYLLS